MFAQDSLERCALISQQSANSKEHRREPAGAIRYAAPHIWKMNDFDYAAPAEVFACKSRGSSPRPVTYRRFDSGAEAIRFAIEELPSDVLFGTVLEVDEQRFDAAQIRKLYESKAYPLQRRGTA
jgi:hypothetical protein